MDDICWMSGSELANAVKQRELSPVEVINAFLDRIKVENRHINAVVTLAADAAMEEARAAEKAIMDDQELGPLHGVPVLLKDNVFTRGIRTTFGSQLFENFVPEEDAVLVERLKAAGAIVLGKTNLSEFGLLPIADNNIFGPTRNPWNLEKTSGGSSGGSAAGVALGLSPLSIGNDVGGSIRIPASLCGVVGFKASFGKVPCYPRLSNWDNLLHEGPITRTVEDAALMLEIISGPDERDMFSLPLGPENYSTCLTQGVRGLKIAYSPDLGYAAVEPEIKEKTHQAALVLEKEGGLVDEVNVKLPDMRDALQTISITEALTANEERLGEWREKAYPVYFGFLSKKNELMAQDLCRIQFPREELWKKTRKIFGQYDLLLTPTSAVAAFDLGLVGPAVIDGKKVRRLSWIAFTYPFNFTGQPAISVPGGFTEEGLPIGVQIVGRRLDERSVFRAAAAIETASPWRRFRPGLK